MFTCRTCRNTNFAISDMKKEPYLTANNRGVCKACYSKNETCKIMIARAERNPENYLTCDDCDGIMKNMTGGRYNRLRVDCRFCKSENLERY